MSRITRKNVESLVTQLNEVLDRPTTPYTVVNGTYTPNPNNISLVVVNEKYYRLEIMHPSGGSSDLGSGGTLSEIEKYIRGMFAVIYGLPKL